MRVIYVEGRIGERIGERNDANYDKLVSELVSDLTRLEHQRCDPLNVLPILSEVEVLFEHLRCEYWLSIWVS